MNDHHLENEEDEIEITMDTLDSTDKDRKLGRPELSASEILLKYKTKILEKENKKEGEEKRDLE